MTRMAYRLLAIVAVAFVLGFSPGLTAQISLGPFGPFLTSDQIIAAAGGDADSAAALVSQGLSEYFRVLRNQPTTVIASQIPAYWLPTIPGVQFQRLDDAAARAHFQACGRILFVLSLGPVTAHRAKVAIGAADQCGSSGSEIPLSRSADEWEFPPPKIVADRGDSRN